jgi:PmbA protein
MGELLGVACALADQADSANGEEVEAYVSKGNEVSIRVYDGEIEHLASAESAGIGVRVVQGHRQGFSWVASLDDASAKEALAEARDNAAYATIDEHVGLASPDAVRAAHLDLWRDETTTVGTDTKIDLAMEVDRLVRSADPRIRQVVSSDYSDAAVESAVASSRGISASSRRTTCHLFVYAIAGDAAESQTGFGYSVGRSPGELDVEKCSADAVERAVRLLGAKRPASRRLTAVLDQRVTATLLALVARTLSGEEVAKGRSLFKGRLGEQVAAPHVTFTDDPTNSAAVGATAHDAEGLATRANTLIDSGQLKAYLYDTYAGRLAGTSSTGSAVRGGYRTPPGVGARAVALVPGKLSQAEILSQVGDGVFVQSVSGVHSGVNPVSGDFSVGAEGLMIRSGELAEPVREMTVASTLQRMLQGLRHIGADLEWLPGMAAGLTLAIDDVSVAGD